MRAPKLKTIETKKTTSRKSRVRDEFGGLKSAPHSNAPSAAASRVPSAANSTVPSAVPSRDVSPSRINEFEELSPTVSPTEDNEEFEETEETTTYLDINAVMDDVTNVKRNSLESRERAFMTLNKVLRNVYSPEEVESRSDELTSAAVKSIKHEASDRETLLACSSLALLAITCGVADVYDGSVEALRRAITMSASYDVKAAAIRTLGIVTLFAGAGEADSEQQMSFLMEIIESDGRSANAFDDVKTVKAAIDVWGLLATEVEDLEQESEPAVEALMEQLDSGDATVSMAAGEAIALLYEKSYTPIEEGEERPKDISLADEKGTEVLVKRYNAYHHDDQVIHKVEELAKLSGRNINRNTKRQIHQVFSMVKETLENPRHGPYYSTALDPEGNFYGTRKAIRLKKDTSEVEIVLDKWWKYFRYKALSKVLLGGLPAHYMQGNDALEACLPTALAKKVRKGK